MPRWSKASRDRIRVGRGTLRKHAASRVAYFHYRDIAHDGSETCQQVDFDGDGDADQDDFAVLPALLRRRGCSGGSRLRVIEIEYVTAIGRLSVAFCKFLNAHLEKIGTVLGQLAQNG